jgi:hypothetical protein
MSAQDFGVFGKPFTQNNSMGALGGGLGQEYGPWINNRNSNAAISGMWNSTTSTDRTGSSRKCSTAGQISPIVYLSQRPAVYGVHGIQQEL